MPRRTFTSPSAARSASTAGRRVGVVHGERDRDLGGRDEVHRRAVAVEHLEHPGHEAVGHQHARLRDEDDRDALLEGDGARLAGGPPAPAAVMSVPGAVGLQRVQDAHRDAALDRGPDGRGVQDLGPEVGELGRLVEADLGQHPRRRHHARVDGHHAVHVGPDLDLLRAGSAAPMSAPTSRSRRGPAWWSTPCARGADEAGQDGHRARLDERAAARSRTPRRRLVHERPARPNASSVTIDAAGVHGLRRAGRARRRAAATISYERRSPMPEMASSERGGQLAQVVHAGVEARAARATTSSTWARRRSRLGAGGHERRRRPRDGARSVADSTRRAVGVAGRGPAAAPRISRSVTPDRAETTTTGRAARRSRTQLGQRRGCARRSPRRSRRTS